MSLYRESAEIYRLNLFGPFAVIAPDGGSVKIASKRSRALLAALACGKDGQRTRDWMQELLWSGRGKTQASASLRQELRTVRRAFDNPDVIVSEHGVLRLNSDLIASNFDTPPPPGSSHIFLEGLELNDAFSVWVAEQRSYFSGGAAARSLRGERTYSEADDNGAEPVIYLNRMSGDELELEVANEVFQSHIVKGLSDVAPIELRYVDDEDEAGREVLLKTQMLEAGQQMLLRVALPGFGTGQRRWSAKWRGMKHALLLCEEDELLQLAFRAQEEAIEALRLSESERRSASASLLAFRALSNIFGMDPTNLEQVDRDLAAAYSIAPRGVYKAWRAFVQANLIVESSSHDPEEQKSLAVALARDAVQEDPENAALKAAVAHVLILTGQEVETAGELARDASVLNPSNPLGWASIANAKIAAGLFEGARFYSSKALKIGRFSKSRHWWEMQAGVSAALVGDFTQARTHSRMAHSLLPQFRPPLRYLAALEHKHGDVEASEDAVRKMQALEEDFVLSDLAEPDYPSGNLRRAGLA